MLPLVLFLILAFDVDIRGNTIHNDSVMGSYGKFLVGIGAGFVVFVGAFTLRAIMENLGFPVASATQASAQMLYFMLAGWGMVAFVNHHQKTLRKEVENAKWSASFREKETQRQKDYKDFYKKLAKQCREHLQQIKATFGER